MSLAAETKYAALIGVGSCRWDPSLPRGFLDPEFVDRQDAAVIVQNSHEAVTTLKPPYAADVVTKLQSRSFR